MNDVPGWVPPTIAISLVFIALAFVAIAAATVMLLRRVQARLRELERRLTPVVDAVYRLADVGEDLGDRIRAEVLSLLKTSRYVRRGVVRGVHRVRGRLQDLDALYEVVHDEVEDTALDVAARLRSIRSGGSVVQRIRQLLVRGRR